MKTLPVIQPMIEADLAPLVKAAEADDHGVIGATHVIKRGNDIIGYMGVGSVPQVMLWYHTKEMRVTDSLYATGRFESMLPRGLFTIPMSKSSPVYPYMEKAGYIKLFDATIFGKVI